MDQQPTNEGEYLEWVAGMKDTHEAQEKEIKSLKSDVEKLVRKITHMSRSMNDARATIRVMLSMGKNKLTYYDEGEELFDKLLWNHEILLKTLENIENDLKISVRKKGIHCDNIPYEGEELKLRKLKYIGEYW